MLLGSAVALASTIYARPAFFRRAVADAKDVLACVPAILFTGQISPTCQALLGQDFKLVQGVTVPSFSFDLTGTVPHVSANNIRIELLKFKGFPSIPVTKSKLDVATLDGAGARACSFVGADLLTTVTGFSLSLGLPPTPLTISTDETPIFIKLLSSLATKESYVITLQGKAEVELTISIPGSKA
ncbi:hypothetical protein BGZ83_011143, partial [Gryganskiella cystojenkinii]